MVRLQKLHELRQQLQQRYTQSSGIQLPAPQVATHLEDTFLQQVQDIIHEHITDAAFGNEQLAKAMFLSESQLFRKLKALCGKSTANYIRSIRLQKALELLQTSDKTITAIAFDVGFNDPAYFSRTFSKEFGKPPSQIRG